MEKIIFRKVFQKAFIIKLKQPLQRNHRQEKYLKITLQFGCLKILTTTHRCVKTIMIQGIVALEILASIYTIEGTIKVAGN